MTTGPGRAAGDRPGQPSRPVGPSRRGGRARARRAAGAGPPRSRRRRDPGPVPPRVEAMTERRLDRAERCSARSSGSAGSARLRRGVGDGARPGRTGPGARPDRGGVAALSLGGGRAPRDPASRGWPSPPGWSPGGCSARRRADRVRPHGTGDEGATCTRHCAARSLRSSTAPAAHGLPGGRRGALRAGGLGAAQGRPAGRGCRPAAGAGGPVRVRAVHDHDGPESTFAEAERPRPGWPRRIQGSTATARARTSSRGPGRGRAFGRRRPECDPAAGNGQRPPPREAPRWICRPGCAPGVRPCPRRTPSPSGRPAAREALAGAAKVPS